MNREECKTILLNSGMDPELLKKPAIFEKCLEEYSDKDASGHFSIIFDVNNGTYTVGKKRSDGWSRKVDIISGGQTYSGKYVEASDFGDFTSVKYSTNLTENGLIKDINVFRDSTGPLDGGLGSSEKLLSKNNMLGEYVDFGFISYRDFLRNSIALTSSYIKKRHTVEDLMTSYDEHHRKVVEIYPDLDEYYKSKRTSVAKSAIVYSAIHGNQSLLDVSQSDYDTYGFTDTEKELIEQLKEESSIRKSNEEQISALQGMLRTAMRFAESVRVHPIGKLFFKDDIPNLEIPHHNYDDNDGHCY